MGFTGDIPLSPDLRKVARVACNGCKENAPKLYNYTGIKDCHLVAKYYGGPGKCNFGCLGFGSCVKIVSLSYAISYERKRYCLLSTMVNAAAAVSARGNARRWYCILPAPALRSI